jgi:hypothetical protein
MGRRTWIPWVSVKGEVGERTGTLRRFVVLCCLWAFPLGYEFSEHGRVLLDPNKMLGCGRVILIDGTIQIVHQSPRPDGE